MRTYQNRALILLVLACLFGCGGDGGTGKSEPTQNSSDAFSGLPRGEWRSCPPEIAKFVLPSDSLARFDCAVVEVPVDYDTPSLGTISIPLIRARATNPEQRLGALLWNPGGPGGTTVDATPFMAIGFSEEVRERFDIVGFDVRGLGYSRPRLDCPLRQGDSIDAPDSTEEGLTIEEHAQAAARRYRELYGRCHGAYGAVVEHMGTKNVARDMDRIRQFLGEERISFIGYSYGTLLGTVYAAMFPSRVDRLVLDSVDSIGTLTSVDYNFDMGATMEGIMQQFFQWCRAPVCKIANPQSTFEKIVSFVQSSGEYELERTFFGQLFQFGYGGLIGFPYIAETLIRMQSAIEKGQNMSELTSIVEDVRRKAEMLDSSISVMLLTNAADTYIRFSDREVASYQQEVFERYPTWRSIMDGGSSQSYLSQWYPSGIPVTKENLSSLSLASVPPTLLVNSLLDPATPYPWAQDMRARLPNARLITWRGIGHANSYKWSTCARTQVDTYLLSGQLPKDDVVCD